MISYVGSVFTPDPAAPFEEGVANRRKSLGRFIPLSCGEGRTLALSLVDLV